MIEDNRIKTFIRKHPTEVVVGVAIVGICVGWKLKSRSVKKVVKKGMELTLNLFGDELDAIKAGSKLPFFNEDHKFKLILQRFPSELTEATK